MHINVGRIFALIVILSVLGLIGYGLHETHSEASPQNLLYVYQSLITGVLAALAAGITVYEMRRQATENTARHEKDMAQAEQRHQAAIATRQQEQSDIRTSQLSVYKLAAGIYINDRMGALDRCVDDKASMPGEYIIHINEWNTIGTPPPDIVLDYYYISKVPAQDIGKCLNIMIQISNLYRSIKEYHDNQRVYNKTLSVDLKELDENRRLWSSLANTIRSELATLN